MRVQPVWHTTDKFPCLSRFQCTDDLLVRGVGIAPFHVVTNASREEDCLLRNDADRLSESIKVVFCYNLTVDAYRSRIGAVEAGDQT